MIRSRLRSDTAAKGAVNRRWHRLRVAAACFVLVGISILRAPVPARAQQSLILSVGFEYLRQGTAGVMTLSGPDMAGAVASTMGLTCPFFPVSTGYACLLAVPLDERIKDYPLVITANKADGSSATWQGTLKVASGQFVAEPAFTIPADKFYLLRPGIEASETRLLQSVYSPVTRELFWDGPLTPPVDGALTSPFGSVRSYSDGTTRRHTGYDLRAPTGTPVSASSNGRVVLARPLDIHGNIIVIDHGEGLFSSYSHLSALFVVPGQFVLQGQVIGLSGNTGRSLGPHVHWEIAVRGIVVDPAAFRHLKLPT